MDIFNNINVENLPRHMIKNLIKNKILYVKTILKTEENNWIYDGDTFDICFALDNKIYRESLRVYGYDTPEIRTKNMEEKRKGNIMKKKLFEILKDKILFLEGYGSDKYGRLLGKIYLFPNLQNKNFKYYEDAIIKKKENLYQDLSSLMIDIMKKNGLEKNKTERVK